MVNFSSLPNLSLSLFSSIISSDYYSPAFQAWDSTSLSILFIYLFPSWNRRKIFLWWMKAYIFSPEKQQLSSLCRKLHRTLWSAKMDVETLNTLRHIWGWQWSLKTSQKHQQMVYGTLDFIPIDLVCFKTHTHTHIHTNYCLFCLKNDHKILLNLSDLSFYTKSRE